MITLHFDGACTPVNPGGVGTFGFVVDFHDGLSPLCASGVCDDGKPSTNNIAEYHGILCGLRLLHAKMTENENIQVFGDSALVVNMVAGLWGRKNPHKNAPHLLPLLEEATQIIAALSKRGNKISVRWIPREKNEIADSLTKMAYKQYAKHTRK